MTSPAGDKTFSGSIPRDPARLDEATGVVAEALVRRFGSGVIDGKIQALVVTVDA